MVKKIATKEVINSMINEFKNGVKDTRKDLFEIYFGINNDYELDLESVSEFEDSKALISDFLKSISVFIDGVGMNDKEYLRAEEKFIINTVTDILNKYNSKEKAIELLKYSQGEVANLEWLNGEEEMYYINYLSMPILKFTIKNYIRNNFE